MRVMLVMFLAVCLLFSVSVMACADIFRLTPEVIDAELDTGNNSESGNIYNLSAELNFVVLRTGLDLGYGELDDTEYTMSGVRIGTELPLVLFKLIAFGGYQAYKFEFPGVDIEVKGTVLGVGLEHKMNNFFSLRGVAIVSADMEAGDKEVDFNSAKLDLIFTTAPLVDFFVGYRTLEFESDSRDLDISGLAAGMRIGL